jgi:hypothetical protein
MHLVLGSVAKPFLSVGDGLHEHQVEHGMRLAYVGVTRGNDELPWLESQVVINGIVSYSTHVEVLTHLRSFEVRKGVRQGDDI